MIFLADRSVFPYGSEKQAEANNQSVMLKQSDTLTGEALYNNENEVRIH